MIVDRIEKLRFLVDEMRIAFHLVQNLTDPFVTRTIARHILIRAENLIAHARQLRAPLRAAGHDPRRFHEIKESYATTFEEYFQIARHKLGAHMQDLDFGERIELWNDIEITKLAYFVEGAEEIYKSLAAMNLAGYVPYALPPELQGQDITDKLHQYQRAIDNRTGVEMGTDSLALTRNNSAAALNTTPLHARAAQIALIRRWIRMEKEMLESFAGDQRVVRIFKSRILTDIVSFCDCLVTRPVTANAPQAMDGLDKLIQAEQRSSAPIDALVAATNFEAEQDAIRTQRNKTGGHLEVDETVSLATLLADLDAFDLATALEFYDRLVAAFLKLARDHIFLRMYAADGARVFGVTPGHAQAVPFSHDAPTGAPLPPVPPPINDMAAYRKHLVLWLDGNEDQRAEGRHFFSTAFQGSTSLETIDEYERFAGGSFHRQSHEFRKAHQFILDFLLGGPSTPDFKSVLDLLISCRGGWPYPLAELSVRCGLLAEPYGQLLICWALGEIRSAPHQSAQDFLEAQTRSREWAIRLQSSLALFKIYIQSEGVFRINNKTLERKNFDTVTDALLAPMNDSEQLICLLALASIVGGSQMAAFAPPFKGDYEAVQAKVEQRLLPLLKTTADPAKAKTLKDLIQTHDYIGVCVLVALDLDGGEQQPLYRALLQNCVEGSIETAWHTQSQRHLAMAYHLLNDNKTAYDVAKGIAQRDPETADAQILVAQLLGEMPGSEDQANTEIARIRRVYPLNASQEAALAQVEATILARLAAPAPAANTNG